MGCDIHFVIERKRKGSNKWIGVYASGVDITPATYTQVKQILEGAHDRIRSWEDEQTPISSRNYDFFAKLAGVRGEGPEPKGLPDDLSDLAEDEADVWEGDGHSHSYDTLYDFIHTWLSVTHPDKLMLRHAEGQEAVDKLVSSIAGPWAEVAKHETDNQYRIIYWFDN